MVSVNLKHLKRVRAKGRTYWYHQLTGERLPDDEVARIRRILDINAGIGKTDRHVKPGSVAAVANQYRLAPEYRALGDRTRKSYSDYLNVICDHWGRLAVADLQRKHVLALRDHYGDTPAKANYLVTVLRILLAFAVERDLRPDNPAKGIKNLKTGAGYEAWPEWAVDRFLEHTKGTMRTAFLLGLYTGQREGDVLRFAWSDYDGSSVRVVQGKTGARLEIPVHRELRAALAAHPRRSPIILTTTTGRPFTGSNFRHHWRKALEAAGLAGLGHTYHGLRYTAASMLFELGCNPKEVAAITGHKSLAMVAKYGAFADQKRLAKGAILRWEQNTNRTKTGKLR